MKKFLFVLASTFFMLSCSQEEVSTSIENNQKELPELTTAQAQLKFAKLLSQAASNSIEVRSFLKEEALARFDNDYDIFYPLVKDKIVSGNKSFRDILLSYCKDENELAQIECSQLLLNILIPDLSLFWDFNAKTWDINGTEVSVLCRDDENDTLYENGENIGSLPKGEIPGFPCLVVKNNERLKVTNANTRSGEITYEFIDEVFDGTKNAPQARHSDFDIDFQPTEDLGKYVAKSEIMPSIVKAWEEFKNVPNAYQRDYIYYGITKANTPGTLNRNIREKLYRFRINADAFGKIADSDQDPKLDTPSQPKRYLDNAEILKRIWTDGEFDFRFKSYIASEDGKDAMEHVLPFSVNPRDVFSIKKVHVHHKNSTMFRQSKNFYSVDVENLESKWIYPEKLSGKNYNAQVFVLPWDLYSKSLVIHLFAEEFDLDQTEERSRTVVNEFTNKIDFSVEGGNGSAGKKVNLTAKLGYGFSHTKTTTSTTKITTTHGSDDLGTLSFFFYDPIIKAEANGTYELYSAYNGTVEATLLPVDIIK
ncbi:hypothetical protein [Phocaeicola sp.]